MTKISLLLNPLFFFCLLGIFSTLLNFSNAQTCPLTGEQPRDDYTRNGCPYASETCCSSSIDTSLNNKFSSQDFETMYGSESNCCHQRVSDLLCGQQCSPQSEDFVDTSGSVPVLTACPSFCNETFNACKNNYIQNGEYLSSIENLMKAQNPTDPAQAFCESLSQDSDDSSGTTIQVEEGSSSSSSSSSQCFESELSSCSAETGFDRRCPVIPSQKPSMETELSQCTSYNGGSSCCTVEQDQTMYDRFANGGIVNYIFGPKGDCCPDSIAQLFCEVNCGTGKSQSTQVKPLPDQSNVYNVTIEACESYCKSIFESCKDKVLFASVTVEQEMKRINPDKPHEAMCAYVSTSRDPGYEAGPQYPYVFVSMVPDSQECFGAESAPSPPQCEINKEREQSSDNSNSNDASISEINNFILVLLFLFAIILYY